MTTQNPRLPEWSFIISCIVALAIIVTIFGCDCNYHLKRIKAKCNTSFSTDTVYRNDTTFIHSVRRDSVFRYDSHDTVIVHEGRLTMTYFYRDSMVYLSGKCDTVKIVKSIPVGITTIEYHPSIPWKWIAVCLIGLALVLFGVKRLMG